MNITLFGILNGIATTARNANPPDQNAMATCKQMYQMALFNFGTTYDASTTSSTPVYIGANDYPVGDISPSYDTIENLGVTNPRLVGG